MSEISSKKIPLSELHRGQEAVIVSMNVNHRFIKNLHKMGFLRGALIKVERLAPFGDPMELIIKGCHLSLRKETADCIFVVKLEDM